MSCYFAETFDSIQELVHGCGPCHGRVTSWVGMSESGQEFEFSIFFTDYSDYLPGFDFWDSNLLSLEVWILFLLLIAILLGSDQILCMQSRVGSAQITSIVDRPTRSVSTASL